jgi:hypothetical protein
MCRIGSAKVWIPRTREVVGVNATTTRKGGGWSPRPFVNYDYHPLHPRRRIDP